MYVYVYVYDHPCRTRRWKWKLGRRTERLKIRGGCTSPDLSHHLRGRCAALKWVWPIGVGLEKAQSLFWPSSRKARQGTPRSVGDVLQHNHHDVPLCFHQPRCIAGGASGRRRRWRPCAVQCPRLSRQCTLVPARVELYKNSSSSGKSSSSRWRVCGTRCVSAVETLKNVKTLHSHIF